MSAVASIDGRVRVALPELIALRSKVARLPPPPQVSRAPLAGQRAGRMHGRGMDYAESRVYQPGDDVRRMDWRLTARSGIAHTKLFQEEREGRLLVLLDTNASMRFGTRARFKSVQAARVAAAAAWYAVRGAERVGLLAFGGHRGQLKPAGGPRGALALCGALADWDAATPGLDEALSDALQRARRLMHGASRILLVTDGFCIDPAARGRMLALLERASVTVASVADPLELQAPPEGRYPFAHGGSRYDVAIHGAREAEAFHRQLGAGQHWLHALADNLGLRLRTIDTAADPVDAVAALLAPGRAR